ncbi:unnamed protein product [Orchesella dallaii]|uniref:BTB domain-containing protein n=1 Tax=Orchesella dallaii TaxID=48710 RepID=A0ABP1PQU7_9HEXA
MPRGIPSSPCRIPQPTARAPPPTPMPMRTSIQHRDESSSVGTGRNSRLPTKSNNFRESNNPYKYNESTYQGYSNPRRRTSAVNYSGSHSNVPPPPEYTPPQKNRYYGSFRCNSTLQSQMQNQTNFEKDFGPFGSVVMQQEKQQQQGHDGRGNRTMNQVEDINSMFNRPDYNPPPCTISTNCSGGTECRPAASPIQNAGGQYSNRTSMAHADIYGSFVSTRQRNSWDQQIIPAPGLLPPTSQPIINGIETEAVAANGSRRSLKSDELDRILAKYGKSSRSSLHNNNTNNNEQDPDFTCIRVESYRQVTEKCEPPLSINPAIQPAYWNSIRKHDEQLLPINLRGERRRASDALEKSMESLMKQMNSSNNNNNSDSGIVSNSIVTANNGNQNQGEHEKRNQMDKIPEKSPVTKGPEFKRSTHIFPFKETASGHLVVNPDQIAFESRKISVLVADPNSSTVGLELSGLGGTSLHASTSKNERILHEVKRAMSIADAAVDRKNSSSKIQPRDKFYQKKYSDSTCASEDFQKNILERIVAAKNPDTHVMIGDKTYPCHALALQVFSTHFDRLRPEPSIQQIHLPEASGLTEVASSVFPVVMDWIVQSEDGRNDILTKENLVQVYAAAKYLGIRELEFQCVTFLEKKVEASDPDLLTMWDEVKKRQGSFPELVRIIASKLASSYHEIYSARRFLHMEVDELFMLLSSNDISIESYSIFEESYKSQPEELNKWVQKTAMKAPAPRTCLVNKKRAAPYIMEKISLLEDASQTKLRASFNKIPERSSSYTIVPDENHQPNQGTPTIDPLFVSSYTVRLSGGSIDKSKSRIPTIVPSSTGAQTGGATAYTTSSKTVSLADKGTNKRFSEGTSNNGQPPAVHEISKPKVMTNHSSNLLMKANASSDEEISQDGGANRDPLPKNSDGSNK